MDVYEKFAEAFTIFAEYKVVEDQEPVQDGGGLLYANVNPRTVSPSHLARLEELGWVQEDDDEDYFTYAI